MVLESICNWALCSTQTATCIVVRTAGAVVDQGGPADGDKDELGGVWMSLPGSFNADPSAAKLGSAADTDVLFDGTHSCSITLSGPQVGY